MNAGTRPQVTSVDRYRASLKRVSVLDPATERELARAWAKGDGRAGSQLIEASLPFVLKIAREYRRWGVPLEDLIQQGNLGLLKAARKFDPDKNCRLITYASYWIRAEIRDYVVRTYRIVRLGTTRTERHAMRAYRTKSIESAEALAEESGMPLARATKLWPLLSQGDFPLDGSAPDRTAGVERLASVRPDPEELVARQRLIRDVRGALVDALSALTDRERAIVEARLLSEEPDTLEALGRQMGVSKERVRQLEVRARAKLRVQLARFADAA